MTDTLSVPLRHRFSRQTGSTKEGEHNFQAFPPEIIFKNYEAYESYEITLLLRNNDNVSSFCCVYK